MSFDPISAVFDVGSKLIDRLWPNPEQRDAAKLKLVELQQTGELARLAAETDIAKGQLEINKIEAGSLNLFIAGWRPAVGWVCCAALVFQFILAPLIVWGLAIAGSAAKLPPLDTMTLVTLLMSLLGLGGMRTAEKIKNAEGNR